MVKLWAVTDIGLVRKENQDAYATVQETAAGYTICVVCDGMGGPAGGKLASKIAVETFTSELEKVLTPEMTHEQLREASSYAVSLANHAICQRAKELEEYRNMGTTLVAAVVRGNEAVITNVGDSRAYHICESGIRRVTKDHSLVERMVDHGDITAEEARYHPNRNLITRALGVDSNEESDGFFCTLQPGEFLLLCTDGLSGTVTDQEMLFEVIHSEDHDTCLERLLEIARSQGAPDNVTAVLLRNL
jgi:protein phosphatase